MVHVRWEPRGWSLGMAGNLVGFLLIVLIVEPQSSWALNTECTALRHLLLYV